MTPNGDTIGYHWLDYLSGPPIDQLPVRLPLSERLNDSLLQINQNVKQKTALFTFHMDDIQKLKTETIELKINDFFGNSNVLIHSMTLESEQNELFSPVKVQLLGELDANRRTINEPFIVNSDKPQSSCDKTIFQADEHKLLGADAARYIPMKWDEIAVALKSKVESKEKLTGRLYTFVKHNNAIYTIDMNSMKAPSCINVVQIPSTFSINEMNADNRMILHKEQNKIPIPCDVYSFEWTLSNVTNDYLISQRVNNDVTELMMLPNVDPAIYFIIEHWIEIWKEFETYNNGSLYTCEFRYSFCRLLPDEKDLRLRLFIPKPVLDNVFNRKRKEWDKSNFIFNKHLFATIEIQDKTSFDRQLHYVNNINEHNKQQVNVIRITNPNNMHPKISFQVNVEYEKWNDINFWHCDTDCTSSSSNDCGNCNKCNSCTEYHYVSTSKK